MNTTATRVSVEPVTGVMITKVRKVGTDDQTYNIELRQRVLKPVTNFGGLLALTMAGHSKFSSPEQTRVCWQNFSKEQVQALNLPFTLEQINEAGRDGISLLENPLPFNLIINGHEVKSKIVEVDTFQPRSWMDPEGQRRVQTPKTAGQGGVVLTQGGKPIYANRQLAIQGPGITMSFDDEILMHDNQVIGSTLAARAATGNAEQFNQSTVGAAVLAGGATNLIDTVNSAAGNAAGKAAAPATKAGNQAAQ